MRARTRFLTVIVGSLAVLTGAITMGGTGGRALPSLALPVAAAAGPTLTIQPATGLVDGQYVRVLFDGFPALTPDGFPFGFSFRECIAAAKTVATDCTATYTSGGVSNAQGSGSTYLPIYAGNDPLLKSDDGSTSLVCDHEHACELVAFLDAKSSDLTTAVVGPISFGRSPDACPQALNGILGSGSATAYRAIYTWQADACLPPNKLSVDYALNNSHQGWTQFQAGQTDFGVTGPYPPPKPDAGVTPPTYKYAPLTASGLVLAFRMYARNGSQITSLTLTPTLIARIFAGDLTNLARDPDVNNLNPDVAKNGGFPSILQAYARGEFSAETYVFTTWLTKAAPSAWKVYGFGKDAGTPLGITDVFPPGLLSSTNYPTGSRGVALAVVGYTSQTTFDNTGNIGFMDSSTAAFYGLPTASIQEADGSVVAATSDTIAKAIKDSTRNADGTITPRDPTTPDPGAWPMPIPSYMLVPTNTIAPEKGVILSDFLKYAVQTGQTTLPAGYAPLPSDLVNVSLAAAGLVPGVAPSPTPTPTPTPRPSPTPTPRPTASPTVAPLPVFSSSPLVPSSTQNNAAAVSATPGTSAAGGGTGGQVAKANEHPAAIPLGQGLQLAALIQSQDSTAAADRYLLPLLLLAGLLALAGGALVQMLARRRRP